MGLTYCASDHQRPAVACVGIGDEGYAAVKASYHAGVGGHVVHGSQAEIRHAKDRDGGAGSSLGFGC